MKNNWAVKIPWAMGLIGTRSTTAVMPGIHDILKENHARIESGHHAVVALDKLRINRADPEAMEVFLKHQDDLGFGLLLKRYSDDVSLATPEMLTLAAKDTIPAVQPLFWTFRIMVGLGFFLLFVFAVTFWATLKGNFAEKKWLLKLLVYSLPLPWLACEMGWFVAEFGRQPWTVYGVLPTTISVSSLSPGSVYGSLIGFITFYTILLIVEMYLMIRFAKQGPGSLGTSRYAHEPQH